MVGFADNYTLTDSSLIIGLLVNGSQLMPISIYNGEVFTGPPTPISFPMVPMISYGYEDNNLTVYYVIATSSGEGKSTIKYSSWRSPVTEKFMSLYPVIMVMNYTTVVERFGVIPSDYARIFVKGLVTYKVYGPYPSGMYITTIVIERPTVITYTEGRVIPTEGVVPGITFKGFRGFKLSITVGTIQLQNIEITEDPLTLSLPLGFTALLVVDTSQKAVSITQIALPLPPMTGTVTLAPPPSLPGGTPVITRGVGDLRYAIIAITLAGVALGVWRRTGDFGFGIALAGFTGIILFLAIGNTQATAIAAFIVVIGVAVSIAERRY